MGRGRQAEHQKKHERKLNVERAEVVPFVHWIQKTTGIQKNHAAFWSKNISFEELGRFFRAISCISKPKCVVCCVLMRFGAKQLKYLIALFRILFQSVHRFLAGFHCFSMGVQRCFHDLYRFLHGFINCLMFFSRMVLNQNCGRVAYF